MIKAHYDRLNKIKELEIEGTTDMLINELSNMFIDLMDYLKEVDSKIDYNDVVEGLKEYKYKNNEVVM